MLPLAADVGARFAVAVARWHDSTHNLGCAFGDAAVSIFLRLIFVADPVSVRLSSAKRSEGSLGDGVGDRGWSVPRLRFPNSRTHGFSLCDTCSPSISVRVSGMFTGAVVGVIRSGILAGNHIWRTWMLPSVVVISFCSSPSVD